MVEIIGKIICLLLSKMSVVCFVSKYLSDYEGTEGGGAPWAAKVILHCTENFYFCTTVVVFIFEKSSIV